MNFEVNGLRNLVQSELKARIRRLESEMDSKQNELRDMAGELSRLEREQDEISQSPATKNDHPRRVRDADQRNPKHPDGDQD